jgi:GAF domain-containing protein
MNEEAITNWLMQNPEAAARIIKNVQPNTQSSSSHHNLSSNNLNFPHISQAHHHSSLHRKSQTDLHEIPVTPHHGSTYSLATKGESALRSSSTFFEIARTVYSSLELPVIIERVLSVAVTLVHAERCSVFLIDENNNELYSTAFDVRGRDSTEDLAAAQRRSHSQFRQDSVNHGDSSSNNPNIMVDDAVISDEDDNLGNAIAGMGLEVTVSADELDQYTSKSVNPGFRIKVGSGVSGYVAKTGRGLNVRDAYKDYRFNPEFDKKTGFKTRNILCLPIFGGQRTMENPKGKILGVANLVNKCYPDGTFDGSQDLQFTEDDIQTFKDFLVLVGIGMYSQLSELPVRDRNCKLTMMMHLAIYNSMLYEKTKKKEMEAQRAEQKSRILLELAKALYCEQTTTEVCQKIIIHARDLTQADQASCFLVDTDNQSLYSTIFNSASGKRISFPMSKGIAGFVATSGKLVNLKNAYDDNRFNREVRVQVCLKCRRQEFEQQNMIFYRWI